jgi:Uma2 family endonuclease
MTLASASPPAPSTTPEPLELEPEPLVLPWDLRLTVEQFERVCQTNPDAVLELDADGHLIAMTPTGGETGARNLRLGQRLLLWADGPGDGAWIAFDSSTGFRLPDGSVLSPDASLVRLERWQALSPEQRRGFPSLCPDLVVELASPSDEGQRGVTFLRRKMGLYQTNGAQLGWLLLPEERAVEIWRGGQVGMAERLENATRLEAGEAFAGLALELVTIWEV